MRQGEACLRWKDVDFEKNTVSICGSLKAHDLYKDLYYGESKTEMSLSYAAAYAGAVGIGI